MSSPKPKRFRRKPEVIEAVQFDGTLESRPPGVKLNRVGHEFKLRNELHKSWNVVKPGDWIRVDKAPEDVYPIDRATFGRTYEPVEEPSRIVAPDNTLTHAARVPRPPS